jgi:ELP3 family radical SAM enzyme/protein acetyltransferase
MDIEDFVPVKAYQYNEKEIMPLVREIVNTMGQIEKNPDHDTIHDYYNCLMRKYKVQATKTQMRAVYETHFKDVPINSALKRYFIKRVSRSESGVLVVTIVTKPGEDIKFSCPEKCAYCPTETNLQGVPTQPKSYISTEPAMLRATRHKFDIGDQIRDRVRSYIYTGNLKKDNQKKKFEVILSGGTWDVMPKSYRDQVINEIYYTFNTFLRSDSRPMLSIAEEIAINQISIFGVIGLTIETRPDYVTDKALLEYLKYGVTRVQLGGQSTHDDILLKIKRGCTNKNMMQAIRKLKGIGMKVVTHWMPDLPGSSPQRDMDMFDELISNPDLQSDDWKIYPCAVVKSASEDLVIKSEINDWYEDGSYVPYSETNIDSLIDVCIYFKQKINPWVRIERLIRDIPTQSIEVGYSKLVNMRQVIKDRMTSNQQFCKCIRCMEIKDKAHLIDQGKLVVRKYEASKGTEYHISFELEREYWSWSYIWFCLLRTANRCFGKTLYYKGNISQYNGLFGFLRLRIDSCPGLNVVDELTGCGLIREVHVYGMSTGVGNNLEKSSQHKGIGQLLMKTSEDIIKTHGLSKAAVIAGVGAREYYKNKCGYELKKYYMVKEF